MPIYIANQEAEDLAREVAALTGETITEAVIRSLHDRREKLRTPTVAHRVARLRQIADASAKIIAGAKIDADDLYDDDGLPK